MMPTANILASTNCNTGIHSPTNWNINFSEKLFNDKMRRLYFGPEKKVNPELLWHRKHTITYSSCYILSRRLSRHILRYISSSESRHVIIATSHTHTNVYLVVELDVCV